MPWCNASQLSAQWIWEKNHKTFSTENLDGSWWLSRTSISNYIFFFLFSFFFFFIQTIVQYLHLQIKSFLISLSTCNICFVSFFKLIVLYISNIQKKKQLFWKHIQKGLRLLMFLFFFLTGLNPLKHLKKNSRWCWSILKEKACSSTVLHGFSSLYIKTISSIINWFHF